MNEKQKAELYDKALAGTITYEEAADMFVNTFVGQSTGVDRETLLKIMRVRYPTQQRLCEFMQQCAQQLEAVWAAASRQQQH